MILSAEQIRFLLDLVSYKTVAEFDGYRVQKKTHGYQEGEAGKIQAALSIYLQVATSKR